MISVRHIDPRTFRRLSKKIIPLANSKRINHGVRLNNYIVSLHDIQISGKDYVCINMHANMHTYGLVGQQAQKYEEEP